MKRRTLLLAALVVAVVLVLSVSTTLADPPANSGPLVVRFEGEFLYWYADARSGLSVGIGADPAQTCAGNWDEISLVDTQWVDVPDDANRIIEITHGDDVITNVWPFTEFDCGLFTTVEPVATGASALVLTDNDVFVYENPDNVNHNAFGFTAHGYLTTADGRSVRFNGVSRCVWDGVDGGDGGPGAHCVERINLK